MFFFNTTKAINDLKTNSIDDKETLKYLFGLGIISGFGLPMFMAKEDALIGDIFEIIVFIIPIIALFIILRKTYELNSKADGKNYLNRFLVLNFMVLLKVLIVSLALTIILFIITSILANNDFYSTQPSDSTTETIMFIAFSVFIFPFLSISCTILWYFLLSGAFVRLTYEINLEKSINDDL